MKSESISLSLKIISDTYATSILILNLYHKQIIKTELYSHFYFIHVLTDFIKLAF